MRKLHFLQSKSFFFFLHLSFGAFLTRFSRVMWCLKPLLHLRIDRNLAAEQKVLSRSSPVQETRESFLVSVDVETKSVSETFELQHNWLVPHREGSWSGRRHWSGSSAGEWIKKSVLRGCSDCRLWTGLHSFTNNIDGATDGLHSFNGLCWVFEQGHRNIWQPQTCDGCIILKQMDGVSDLSFFNIFFGFSE